MITPCPNCSEPIEGHPDNGCVLRVLMQVLEDRQDLTPEQLFNLHAKCDTDALWTDLGAVIDNLEEGHYSEEVIPRGHADDVADEDYANFKAGREP